MKLFDPACLLRTEETDGIIEQFDVESFD
jgi:hypothetical protein